MGESHGWLFEPSFNRSVKVQASDERITSDGGFLLLREADHRLGLTEWLARPLPRDGLSSAAGQLLGGRVVKHARRLTLCVARVVAPFWEQLVACLRRWKLPSRFAVSCGPKVRAWLPPPRHAFLHEVRRQ